MNSWACYTSRYKLGKKMKKNLRVIQINGFRGLFIVLFALSCLIAGFIAFPSFLAMHTWNYLSDATGSFPEINFIEGMLLWGIIIVSAFIFNKKKFVVSFNTQQELSDEEVKEVITKIKAQKDNLQLMHSKDLSIQKMNKTEEKPENKEHPELTALQSENKEN